MLYLLFAILSSTGIFICFKYLEKFKIDILNAIIINYITAAICGLLLSDSTQNFTNILSQEWLTLAIFIGILFIVVFFIIGTSTQKAGISVTTLASKMSFVIPMVFSFLYYQETINSKKLTGITLAILAVLFSIYRNQTNKTNKKYIWLPILLFFGAGTVDSLVKFAQEEHLQTGGTEEFSTLLFTIAALSGIIAILIRKDNILHMLKPKVLLGGSLLGLVNFGSLYFLIASLSHSGYATSIVFSIINIGIVSLSVIIGITLFKEKLNKVNLLGILLAFIAIFILTN